MEGFPKIVKVIGNLFFHNFGLNLFVSDEWGDTKIEKIILNEEKNVIVIVFGSWNLNS